MTAVFPIEIGVFVTPSADGDPIGQIVAADESGLDAVAIQDHPYQPSFHETWTLLAYAGARTSRVRLVPDVVNLPLRPPSVLAKSAATLDRLTGGRVELGLGAGAFWPAIEAIGGPRRSPGESVEALEEAIAVLRGWWGAAPRLRVEGIHYPVRGAHPGPSPAHPIGLWIGARKPRMLRLTGRLGDGWLPSYGPGRFADADDLRAMWSIVEDSARRADRDPDRIRRVLNVMEPGPDLAGSLARLVTESGFTTLLVAPPEDDPLSFIRRLGEDVAPHVRELAG